MKSNGLKTKMILMIRWIQLRDQLSQSDDIEIEEKSVLINKINILTRNWLILHINTIF